MAVGLVLVLGLGSAGKMIAWVPVMDQNATVAAFQSRFSSLRGVLPSRGRVGYVSDSDFFGDLYLTQYVLVPNVIDWRVFNRLARPAESPDIVVGNFKSLDNVAATAARNGLSIVMMSDGGAVILERERK